MPVNKANSAANEALCERDVVAIVAGLARELHPQRSQFIDVDASSRIERDLGIDSLGRTELAMRIERAFRVRLPTADYSAAVKIDAKFFGALTDRGYAYLDKGAYDNAIADFDAAITLKPSVGGPHSGKAEVLLAKKNLPTRWPRPSEGVRLSPDEDEAYSVRGEIFRALGRADEAKADYQKALAINQNNKAAADGLKNSRPKLIALKSTPAAARDIGLVVRTRRSGICKFKTRLRGADRFANMRPKQSTRG